MTLAREQHLFPTRSYPYRSVSPNFEADAADTLPMAGGRVYAFVLGIDASPRSMSDPEIDATLRDPFSELLLKRGAFPLTLRALLSALDSANIEPEGVPQQVSFLVADGGQIPWSEDTSNVQRFFRFAIVRSRGGNAELMISGSTALDSEIQFLQLIAWDPTNAVYNYYERRGGTWIWCGNSDHALAPPTRGCGPFDSHVNGSLVMKELRAPWNNWHSMSASIPDTVLAPNDPLRNESIFANRQSAHELERRVVRAGIERWTQARFAAASASGSTLEDVRYFLRQVLETTTFNLSSANQQSAEINADSVLTLPPTFFLNTDALLDEIGLEPDLGAIRVPGRLYRDSLARYEFALTDGTYKQAGDTFFAFLVPEPAFEDINVLSVLLRERVLSRRFAACLLMIDFQNPILSARRKRLMAYVPAQCRLDSSPAPGLRADLETAFVAALEQAPAGADSPEAEFLANWRLPESAYQHEFARRIEAYFVRLSQQGQIETGFDGWVRLAESRRRFFRRRPLAEFRLTTPVTNIPEDAPLLEMVSDGTVRTSLEVYTA